MELPNEVTEFLDSSDQAIVSDAADALEEQDIVGQVTVDLGVDKGTNAEVVEFEILLDLDRWNYDGLRHGDFLYEKMEEYGVPRPEGTPYYGVNFDGNQVYVRNRFTPSAN